jgi:rhodanese-related sulfurtransferase
MIKKVIFIIGMIFSFFCCARNHKYVSYAPAEFEKLINENASIQLVDVRRPEEYDAGHIDNAVLINVLDSGFVKTAVSMLNKSKPVAVYCRSGNRSKNAADKLVKKGYKVYDLDGGYVSWVEYLSNKSQFSIQ